MDSDWKVVGYHAVEQSAYEDMKLKDSDSNLCFQLIKPMIWSMSPLEAIYLTKKQQARKLGGSVSDPDSDKLNFAKTRLPKGPSKISAQALEKPNYVILRLQTKENMPDMFARDVFKTKPMEPTFEMSEGFDVFGHLQLPGEWLVDIAWLSSNQASNSNERGKQAKKANIQRVSKQTFKAASKLFTTLNSLFIRISESKICQ